MGQNGRVPELPEVQALVDFLHERTDGLAIAGVELGSISVLKTYDPPPQALGGLTVTGVARHGKFIDLDADGLHLVFHLARAGWLRWSDALPATPLRPGKSPIALRCRLSDGSGFDLTEAGTRKRLAAYIVRDPAEVPGIATLGPDPLADGFGLPELAAMLSGRRTQIKGLLRDQGFIAGVGNAYSDEVLHAARLSPFAPGLEPGRGAGGPSLHRPAGDPRARGRGRVRQAGQGAQGRQACRHARARPHRPAVPGVRRHRP